MTTACGWPTWQISFPCTDLMKRGGKYCVLHKIFPLLQPGTEVAPRWRLFKRWKHCTLLTGACRPPYTSVSLCQAKRLRGAGAGDRGASAAVRPGLHPHPQSVEAGLRRTAVVHGLRAEVRVLPSSLVRSLRDENPFLLTSSSEEGRLPLTLRPCKGQSPWRRQRLRSRRGPGAGGEGWEEPRVRPSCCPGCGRAREAASVAAWYPPRSLSDQAAWLWLSSIPGTSPGREERVPSAWYPAFSGSGVRVTKQFV